VLHLPPVAALQLYQMLTGRMPFWPKKTLEEVAKLPRYEIVAAVGNYEVQFPRSLWANISPDAKELVERMLDRNPATRITAAEALQHPWLCATLGYTPTPSSDSAVGANNVVEFRSPLRPKPVAISPGKGSLVPGPLSPQKSGPLSPQKSSPLRSMLSGELPASLLMADLQRQPMPACVPAAE
jgi:serine/threonine protein kinase